TPSIIPPSMDSYHRRQRSNRILANNVPQPALPPDERSGENIPHSHSASILLGRSRDLGLDRPPTPRDFLPAYSSWKTREKNPARGKSRPRLALEAPRDHLRNQIK